MSMNKFIGLAATGTIAFYGAKLASQFLAGQIAGSPAMRIAVEVGGATAGAWIATIALKSFK